jgi:hypothetical protein
LDGRPRSRSILRLPAAGQSPPANHDHKPRPAANPRAAMEGSLNILGLGRLGAAATLNMDANLQASDRKLRQRLLMRHSEHPYQDALEGGKPLCFICPAPCFADDAFFRIYMPSCTSTSRPLCWRCGDKPMGGITPPFMIANYSQVKTIMLTSSASTHGLGRSC